MNQECRWETDDGGSYETDCGESFYFDSGTPEGNGFKFCCFCGGKLVDVTEYEPFSMSVSLSAESKGMVTCTLIGVEPKC